MPKPKKRKLELKRKRKQKKKRQGEAASFKAAAERYRRNMNKATVLQVNLTRFSKLLERACRLAETDKALAAEALKGVDVVGRAAKLLGEYELMFREDVNAASRPFTERMKDEVMAQRLHEIGGPAMALSGLVEVLAFQGLVDEKAWEKAFQKIRNPKRK